MPLSAMAPPVIPAIKECDFDAGIPKNQQNVPHPIEAIIAAINAINDIWASLDPKFTMLNIVSATAVVTYVIAIRPTKFATAAIPSAVPTFMHLVDTAVAIALGASVAPDTSVTKTTNARITPSVG